MSDDSELLVRIVLELHKHGEQRTSLAFHDLVPLQIRPQLALGVLEVAKSAAIDRIENTDVTGKDDDVEDNDNEQDRSIPA